MIVFIMQYERITITLPLELRDEVDRAADAAGLSRSAEITYLLRRQFAAETEAQQERRWLQGYEEQPLSEDETAFLDTAEAEMRTRPRF